MTFKEVEALAQERGKRLERGTPERPRGMRSGYIVWSHGTWVQVSTLKDARKQIMLGR